MSAPSKSDDKKQTGGGTKVLRVGIVQNGKIIDERELKRRESVSVGTAPKNTFSVASESVPRTFELFELAGNKYYLRFAQGMDARVSLAGGQAVNFEQLKQQGKVVTRGDGPAVELADDSRGKVVIGDVTVLFQFRPALAEPARPVLPADVRGSILQNIDAQFAAIFVVVAIFQISLVTYARSLPYVEPSSIDQVEQRFQRIIMPDRNPEPPKVADNSAGETKAEDKAKGKDDGDKAKSKAKGAAKKGDDDPEAAARARKAAIAKQVAGKGLLKVLGANRGGAGAVNDVFSEGGVTGSLGDAFTGIQGVDFAGSAGESGTRGGGSGEGVGIGDLATSGGGNVNTGGKGAEASVAGSLKTEAPEVDGQLSETEISSVMRRQLKSLRDCYESALKRNRQLAGKLVIKFEIEESGRTQNVDFEEDTLKSDEVRECIVRRAKYWRFPKPDGGSVFVAYPIVFTPAS